MKAHPAKAGVAKPRVLAFPRGAGIQDATEDLKTAELHQVSSAVVLFVGWGLRRRDVEPR
jgi:hypothetical protein